MKIILLFSFIFLQNLFLFSTTINIPADQPTIQQGIGASVNGDTVLVQPGTYFENINYNGKNITVASLFLTTQDTTYISQTTIDGNQNGSVVIFESEEDTTAVLSGFTITNGHGSDLYPYSAGGIYCANSSCPNLANLIITNNYSAHSGGGISCINTSNPIIENVSVLDNYAFSGGGIRFDDCSTPILKNMIISGNIAENNGGGICSYYSNIDMENLIICNNDSNNQLGGGGGFFFFCSSAVMNTIIVSGNFSYSIGGGIFCSESSNLTLEKVSLTNNTASENGGGVYCRSSYLNIVNSTISDNNANEGGGLWIYSASPDFTNCIIWNNYPEELWANCGIASPGNIITIAYSDINEENMDISNTWIFWLEGNINENPLFTDPENGDYHLTENSPCIDAGDPNSPLDPDGTIADMGAFYFDQTNIIDEELIMNNERMEISNYPNPFSSSTTISFVLSNEQNQQNEQSAIEIYNIKGQKIKQFSIDDGRFSIEWNGKDEEGKEVKSGIYFYKLKSGIFSSTKKMILLR